MVLSLEFQPPVTQVPVYLCSGEPAPSPSVWDSTLSRFWNNLLFSCLENSPVFRIFSQIALPWPGSLSCFLSRPQAVTPVSFLPHPFAASFMAA